MVEIEEIVEEEAIPISPSQQRLLDADEIEKAMGSVTRPTAKMQLETLVKKLRKESEALKRVEASKAKKAAENSENETTSAMEQKPPAPKVVAPPPAPPRQVPTSTAAPLPTTTRFTSIDRFSFDAGKYNSPHVMLYVPLPSVGTLDREKITCDFTATSFDLVVRDLNGKTYRLFKDTLAKDIIPESSKYIVKAEKIVIKLAKVKSEYGSYDHWSELVDKKKSKKTAGKKDDPAAGIMDMMKDMYDNGDDNMRKIIGETMMKQRNGTLGDGMGGMGDMDI